MVLADDRILEYLYEEETASPSKMAKSGFVRYTSSYISKRCQKLVDHGLLRNLGRGVYTITERGEMYLEGKLDTAEGSPDRVESAIDESRPNTGENHEQA